MRQLSVLAVMTLGVAFAVFGAPPPTTASPVDPNAVDPNAVDDSFVTEVDLTPFRRLAIHTQGRVKSFDTFTRAMMRFVSGRHRIDDQDHTFTYFDLMFRPERYADRPIIFVKKKLLRVEIMRTLRDSANAQVERIKATRPELLDAERETEFWRGINERLDAFFETGLISPYMLEDPAVEELLGRLSTDVLRTARPVDEIRTALAVREAPLLRAQLSLVPTPGGGFDDPWFTLDEVGQSANGALSALDDERRREIVSAWQSLGMAWAQADAAGVNEAASRLGDLLPAVNPNPEVYPATSRLSWESWYFRSKNMTWVWIVYALALAPLLLFVVFRWERARWLGLVMFAIAFGLHTFSLLLRWYVSGRWPNSNMFEAVTTAAWFGGAFAILFEIFGRRTPIRGLLALGSGVASMVALMCAYYMPLALDPHISNRMPVLHDVWLYIHTNVIIFSYCLIFMASVSAGLYVLYRLAGWMRGREGTSEFARVGGAASLIMTRPGGGAYLGQADRRDATAGAGGASLGQVLDGTTMILMEFSFVLLWAGLVMGAIWADHSWGRPWGWDPKEVFALNTFLVFAVLIHTRFKVRDKGLWTALIAVIGCAVMIFNWVVINFTIAGLHSYA